MNCDVSLIIWSNSCFVVEVSLRSTCTTWTYHLVLRCSAALRVWILLIMLFNGCQLNYIWFLSHCDRRTALEWSDWVRGVSRQTSKVRARSLTLRLATPLPVKLRAPIDDVPDLFWSSHSLRCVHGRALRAATMQREQPPTGPQTLQSRRSSAVSDTTVMLSVVDAVGEIFSEVRTVQCYESTCDRWNTLHLVSEHWLNFKLHQVWIVTVFVRWMALLSGGPGHDFFIGGLVQKSGDLFFLLFQYIDGVNKSCILILREITSSSLARFFTGCPDFRAFWPNLFFFEG